VGGGVIVNRHGQLPLRFNLSAQKKWPIVKNRIGAPVRGVIKEASVQDILRLSAAAKDRHWSATARPSWLTENSEQIEGILVTLLTEDRNYLRCSVVVILSDGSGGNFSLDMSPLSFDELKDLSEEHLVSLAHRYMNSFASIPLDSDQQAKWDRKMSGKGDGGDL
jgi:hypothetical protein